jgi:uncharacterized protein (TIGR01319 family)
MVCRDTEDIVATAKSHTTVESDIMHGYRRALENLTVVLKSRGIELPFEMEHKICSSAAGGLKMIVSGLVKDLTAEAAKLACLGSGAKVLEVYSNKLTHRMVKRLLNQNPDMILLSGGTDGGNSDCILHNAELLAESKSEIPIVVAGNTQAEPDIDELFSKASIKYSIVDNVMPRLGEVNIEPARESIRKLFMERITEAKGLREAKKLTDKDIIPTPLSVLRAAELLSKGTDKTAGWGELMIVDIGGATTDIHSICSGESSNPNAIQIGLIEPNVKRTVEGDLGMRVSAMSLYETVGYKKIKAFKQAVKENETPESIKALCEYRTENTEYISDSKVEIAFDEVMASCAVELAVERHSGRIESVYSPMGMIFYQKGKDLSKVKHIIGTGGILVHSPRSAEILMNGLYNDEKPESLKPRSPKLHLDAAYILSCAGLLAQDYPELSLKIMNKHIVHIMGDENEFKE